FTADDANATYTVTAGGATATITDNGNGTYTATFSPALAAGSEVTVTGTDAAGNSSSDNSGRVPSTVTYEGGDTTAPLISDVLVSQQDISNPADGRADQTAVTFRGDDANALYTVTSGSETAVLVSNGDGTYTATFS